MTPAGTTRQRWGQLKLFDNRPEPEPKSLEPVRSETETDSVGIKPIRPGTEFLATNPNRTKPKIYLSFMNSVI